MMKYTVLIGKYVRLYVEVLLVRNMGFYSMNIVIPSMLIVTISWVSFWLNREVTRERDTVDYRLIITGKSCESRIRSNYCTYHDNSYYYN